MARPMIEVFNVALFPESLPCQVYGDICVYDKYDDEEPSYNKLYERSSEHPELISKEGQCLSLTGPIGALSMPNPCISIQLFIMGTSNNNNNISGDCCLDNSTEDEYEAFRHCQIEGECGVARVYYAAMACAVLAQVSIIVLDPAQKFITSSQEYSGGTISSCVGSIVARYGKTYGGQTSDMLRSCCSDYDYWSSTILKRTQPNDEPIPLEKNTRGELVVLAKDLVAVPAYSPLIITADLKVAINTNNEEEKLLNGFLKKLGSASTACDPEVIVAPHTKYACLFVSCFELPVGRPSPDRDRLLRAASWRLTPYNFVDDDDDGESLVQVYSVFIGRDDDAELSIFGDIKAENLDDDTVQIYHRRRIDPERLFSGKKLLSLRPFPRGFPSYKRYFKIFVSLRDASDRFHIDDGVIQYDWERSPVKVEKSLDKLLCSVIQGQGGYCAVHHTIFRRAVPLLVRIDMIMPHNSGCVSVCGTIAATYDMFDYTFDYDRKYYRRLLFDTPQNNALILSDDPKATFHYNLAMPVDGTALCIHVDLHASYLDEQGSRPRAQHLNKTFRYHLGDAEMSLQGHPLSIVVKAHKVPRGQPE